MACQEAMAPEKLVFLQRIGEVTDSQGIGFLGLTLPFAENHETPWNDRFNPIM